MPAASTPAAPVTASAPDAESITHQEPGPWGRIWGRCFAALYNPLFWRTERRGNAARRAHLLEQAEGRVVELGAGTGLNLAHYPAEAELVLTEPYEPMARRLERRLSSSGRIAEVIRAPAEALPLPDASADTVVSTLVLCTVDDLDATLAEARRVLRPGGRLLFIEHVAGEEGSRLHDWQCRAHGLWHAFACGCNANRRTGDAIRAAGFEIEQLVEDELEFDIPLVRPLIWGSARNPGTGRAAA
jgi:ubiquinone/menaquinone biosynthesis C-methylase UbiE